MRVLLPSYSPFRSPQPPPLLLSREWYTRIHTLRTHMHTHSLTTCAQRVASPENKLEHGCLSKIKVLLDDGLPARQVCIVTFATRLLRLEHHGVRKTFVRKTSVTSQRLIRSCSMTSCRRRPSLVADESLIHMHSPMHRWVRVIRNRSVSELESTRQKCVSECESDAACGLSRRSVTRRNSRPSGVWAC